VAIYNWKTGTLVASAKGEKNKVFSICFNENGTRLAQCERLLLYFERSLLYFERSLRYLFKKT